MKKKVVASIYLICIFLVLLSDFLIKEVTNLDEIWNYNTANAFTTGLLPYKEISLITTPLLPTINAIILNIFGNQLIVFRIISAIVMFLIVFMSYKIFDALLKNTMVNIVGSILVFFIMYDFIALDYNFFVLLLMMIIEFIEIKQIDKKLDNNKWINLLLGLIAGYSICTKQTLGFFVAAEVVLFQLIYVHNKKDLKRYFLNTCYRIIGILIPVGILFLYLLINNSLIDFINYAILGIKTFSNSIPYTRLFTNGNKIVVALSILLPIYLFSTIVFLIIKRKKELNIIKALIIMALPTLIVMYPIADDVHFIIGIIPLFISLIYVVSSFLISKKKLMKYYEKVTIISFLIMLLCFFGVKNFKKYFESEKNIEIQHYKYLKLEEYIKERITEIDSYINSHSEKIYILDAEAALYDIPIDKYSKNFDMFLKGNIGKDGEDGVIEDIKKMDDNVLLLIKKEGQYLNWQTPTSVLKYVKQNYDVVDEVSVFDVYVRKREE